MLIYLLCIIYLHLTLTNGSYLKEKYKDLTSPKSIGSISVALSLTIPWPHPPYPIKKILFLDDSHFPTSSPAFQSFFLNKILETYISILLFPYI
jgi:hypothetical protein